MAKIDMAQFLGKAKEYEVCGQKIYLEPLKGRDMDFVTGIREGHEAEGVKKLVMRSLDLSSEEFDELPVSFLNEVIVAIMDVNGLKK